MHKTRDSFGSKFGAIAALAGSAVGLGNIWKFPYEAGNNGGGAFLIIYIFFTLAIGLPIMLSEFALGRRGQQNAFGTFKTLAPGSKWYLFGLLSIIAAAFILSFTVRSPAGHWNTSGWPFREPFTTKQRKVSMTRSIRSSVTLTKPLSGK